MTYQVTPPFGEQGTKTFRGVISADGFDAAITGTQSILPPPRHPADFNPGDQRISVNETTAYASSWRKGLTWSIGPNPIPVDYVTRAGVLWKYGELYQFDPNIAAPPLWWVSTSVVRPMALTALPSLASASQESSATRVLPRSFVPGESFTVRLLVQPAATALVYAVEEHVPAGVLVSAVSDSGEYDPVHQLVRWGPFFDQSKRELSFMGTSPVPSPELITLTGIASFDGQSDLIGGDNTMTAAFRLSSLRVLPGGQLVLSLAQVDGKSYQVESSRNLVKWLPVVVLINTDGALRFNAPSWAEQSGAFFRAVSQSR